MRLRIAIVFFESSEGGRVPVLALGLVAFEDGGGCVALEGFGGSSCEGAVGVVVAEKSDEWSKGWEALLVISELAVLELEIWRSFRLSTFLIYAAQGFYCATYGSKDAGDGFHSRPDRDPNEIPCGYDVRWVVVANMGNKHCRYENLHVTSSGSTRVKTIIRIILTRHTLFFCKRYIGWKKRSVSVGLTIQL